MTDVIIVGGGLAGLINAILLSRQGLSVVLYEKNAYPFHRVCGEYISNEVKPFLARNGIFPEEYEPAEISKFTLTSTNGRSANLDLDMGGFGISRYAFDQYLLEKALASGVTVIQNVAVTGVRFVGDHFEVSLGHKIDKSTLVIAAHGKRSKLDANLKRDFIQRKSPYLGVKRHIRTDFPKDRVALHNFKNGYCGISRVDGEVYNLCYLSHRDNLRNSNSIADMEQNILAENPFLKKIFENSDSLYDPIVINEISFEKKQPVEDHILMSGDSAGMIAPLCGNGMAMAIHSAKILSETILSLWKNDEINRSALEQEYTALWNQQFAFRLWAGRKIQGLFGAKTASNVGVTLASIKPVANKIVGLTHGKTF